MGVELPIALLCAVAGMMLAFMPRWHALGGALLLVVVAGIAGEIPIKQQFVGVLLGGCWVSLLACALCVFWPRRPATALLYVLAANAGLWSGLAFAAGAAAGDLPFAVAALLAGLPAALAIRNGYEIIPRIVTSWLLAVAMIAAVLPLAVTHPGYVPDHME